MQSPLRASALLLSLSCATSLVAQEVAPLRLMSLFSDHMALPAEVEVAVPGRAMPHAEVRLTASWLAAPVTAVADAQGAFSVRMRTPGRGGPYRFEVACGDAVVRVEDVVAGQVFLASGQSNMEMTLGPGPTSPQGVLDFEAEASPPADVDATQLRLFTVRRHASPRPAQDVEGQWRVWTRDSAKQFSAVAYFFARDLLLRGHGPIGVVSASWGGTVCEAWTRREGLAQFPEFGGALAQVDAIEAAGSSLAAARSDYWRRAAAKAIATKTGEPVLLPHVWSEHGMGDFDGLGCYRRTVTLPASWRGRDLLLSLGPIDDMDVVLVDGTQRAASDAPGRWAEPRQYVLPGEATRGETLELCILCLDTGGEGGIGGSAEACRLQPKDGDEGALSLHEGFAFARVASLSDLPAYPTAGGSNPNLPTVLWNGMIAPLVPFPFDAAIWYQGESNRARAEQYRRLFPAMIQDWRAAFGSRLPFFFVQIAPFGYRNDVGETFRLRLAQECALDLPATGMAVTGDVGEPGDIHPRQKRIVGERLAMQARKVLFGEPDEALEPPRVTSATATGASVALQFARAGRGLRSGAEGPQGFELAGPDGVYRAAKAEIRGDAVVLSAVGVEQPRHVRYCHAAAAPADLWNSHGLPLPPMEREIQPSTAR